VTAFAHIGFFIAMLSFVALVVFGKQVVSQRSRPNNYFVSWKTFPRASGFIKCGVSPMHSLHFHNLAHWFFQFESYGPAILVTIGAALLIACGIGATCSPCEEKDEVFHRQVF
jgi:hypothetical protein